MHGDASGTTYIGVSTTGTGGGDGDSEQADVDTLCCLLYLLALLLLSLLLLLCGWVVSVVQLRIFKLNNCLLHGLISVNHTD